MGLLDKKIKIIDILFIFTIVVICGFKFLNINYFVKYILALLWIFFSLTRRSKVNDKKLISICKIIFVPYCIMLALSPVLILVNPINGVSITSQVSRLISISMQNFIMILFVYAGIRLFGSRTINNYFKGIIINNIIGIIWAIYKYGVMAFLEFIKNPFSEQWNVWTPSGRIINALELHEVTFTFGFFLIYYICFKRDIIDNKKNYNKEVILILIFLLLGFKRIQVAALIGVILLNIFISKNKSLSSRINITLMFTLGIMLFYTWMISSDFIMDFAIKYNINFMSRLEWYSGLRNFFEFNPLFIGHGWGSVSRLIEVYGLGTHSDILRMFIEFGFWGFVLWIIYVIKIIPCYLKKYFNSISSKVFIIFSVYSMITYLTDNTLNYFVFQNVYYTIPILIALNTNNSICLKNKGDNYEFEKLY